MAGRRALRPLPLRFGAGLGALLLAVWGGLWWTNRPDGRFHLIVPAIPGDGVLLKSGGAVALIDGGADGTAVATWLGDELPLGRRQIDLLVLTRADGTTLPGQLAAVRRYHIGRALLVRPDRPQPLWDELVRLLGEQGTPVHMARTGDQVALAGAGGPDARIEVLAATGGRLLLRLELDEQRVLLFQSLGAEPLPAIREPRKVAVVLYPWRRATHDLERAALRPAVIIFGEAPGKTLQATMAARQVGAARLLHEALDGRIDLQFGADALEVVTERRQEN